MSNDDPVMVRQDWLVSANQRAERAEIERDELRLDLSLALELMDEETRIRFWGTKKIRELDGAA